MLPHVRLKKKKKKKESKLSLHSNWVPKDYIQIQKKRKKKKKKKKKSHLVNKNLDSSSYPSSNIILVENY